MLDEQAAVEVLKESGAFLEGHFLLSSGMHSPAYVQCAQLLQYPGKAGLVCAAIAELWKEERPDVVVGPAMGGILVAYEVARALGARALFTERVDGEVMLRRGFTVEPSEKILLCEDIVTSGKSAREAIEALRKMGGNVIGATSIGNRSNENPFDVPFKALVPFRLPGLPGRRLPALRRGRRAAGQTGSRKEIG